MKLEVGMYVRTKKYGIAKIIGDISGKFNIDVFKKDGCTLRCQKEKDILKASFNIIDILEVGDYVNGVEVENIDEEWITMSDMQVPILKSIANGMIKTIVTHEQMEQMAYKVGE